MKAFAGIVMVVMGLLPGIALGALVPSDHPLFDSELVHEIRLTFDDPDFWNTLESNYASETYLTAEFEWEGYEFATVGVRFKGGSSYTSNPTMKKSFKIDFDVFEDDQNISGIYKINLNCNFNDPSFIREASAYEIAAGAGIPCPRTSFAALYINDTYWGLYTMVEQFDKHFIDERFGEGEDGNLWKGDDHGSLEFLGWDESSYYGNYELKTNESTNDWSSLVELCYYLNNTPVSQLPDTLSSVMDVSTALTLMAVDNLVVNLDSYTGRCVNYYLYCADRDDRFVFGEWDMNESWGIYNSWGYSINNLSSLDAYWTNPNSGEGRGLADALWSIDAYKDVYEGKFLRILATDANPSILIPRMEEKRDLIRDWVYLEEAPRSLFNSSQFDSAMDTNVPIGPGRYAPALGTFVEDRYDYLTSQLGTWDPVEDLILNELMAGNDTTIADSYGEYDDWLEITNTGTAPISLSGYFLTDDMAFPEKFAFPDTLIQPGEYMIIWADKDSEQGPLHAEFKLDGDGEELYLMQGAVIVDWISYPEIEDDVSWGRWPDLADCWALQAYPTPGAENTDEEPQGVETDPFSSNLGITCCNPIHTESPDVAITGTSGAAVFTVYDMTGRLVATPFEGELSSRQCVNFDTSFLSSGVYILRLVQEGSVVSEMAMVPESECRTPTLMGQSAANAGSAVDKVSAATRADVVFM